MENISDSHRVITDTSDTKPESGRSIFDKGRTFLRRAGESLEKAGQSMKKYRTDEEQEKLRAFEDKAKTVGERIDLAGLGLLTFGPEAVAPFAADETVSREIEKHERELKETSGLAEYESDNNDNDDEDDDDSSGDFAGTPAPATPASSSSESESEEEEEEEEEEVEPVEPSQTQLED